jgi:hypothetical protein
MECEHSAVWHTELSSVGCLLVLWVAFEVVAPEDCGEVMILIFQTCSIMAWLLLRATQARQPAVSST